MKKKKSYCSCRIGGEFLQNSSPKRSCLSLPRRPDGNMGHAPSFLKFDRLRVRVPTIMVSPWIKKGAVISSSEGPTPTSKFDHSSIPATMKKIFHLPLNFLTHTNAWDETFEQVVGHLISPRTYCTAAGLDEPDTASRDVIRGCRRRRHVRQG